MILNQERLNFNKYLVFSSSDNYDSATQSEAKEGKTNRFGVAHFSYKFKDSLVSF